MCIFTTVMMRKRLSILMILLANILILVHVVIPHHHYNKEFVAVVNMLNEDTRDLFKTEILTLHIIMTATKKTA